MVVVAVKRQYYQSDADAITVSNQNFSRYKSFEVERSIDKICGTFRIVISRPKKNPFKNGTVINVVLDGLRYMKGKIYDVELNGDAKSDDIVISGRDITGDLIDSTVPDDAKVHKAGANMTTIAQKIVDSLGMGIAIINLTGNPIESFTEDEIISCETGQTAIDFLEQYSRKRQLFINTRTDGSLAFFKANGVNRGNRIIHQASNNNNNVITWNSKFNTSDRFYKYICKSQQPSNSGFYDEFTGVAYDAEIDDSRQFEFVADEISSQAECDERAKEESNVRRARAFEYTVTVQGFKDKREWAVNQLVSVEDDFADVHGEFLIKSVRYRLDINDGRTTRIVLTNKDAYTAQESISAGDAKTSNAGKLWMPKPIDLKYKPDLRATQYDLTQ